MREIYALRPAGGFQLIVADPPWPFVLRSAKGEAKSAAAHYRPMSIPAIAALPVEAIAARDALLLLWVTAPALAGGLATVGRWGFRYSSFLAWRKRTINGRAAIGTGYRVRTMLELCLVGVRGSPKHAALPGCFDGVRREHSRKPEEFYDVVGLQCPTLFRRADLFARQHREGWCGWGDELGKFVAEANGAGETLPIVVDDAGFWRAAA